jgi:hypothetical protein
LDASFSSRKQADLIRQEKNIPDDDWQRRRAQLSLSTSMLTPARSLSTAGNSGLAKNRSRSAERKQWPMFRLPAPRKSRNTTIRLLCVFEALILDQSPVLDWVLQRLLASAIRACKSNKSELLVREFGYFFAKFSCF